MNAKQNGATPAHPAPVTAGGWGNGSGLTKREAFAMAAMQGYAASRPSMLQGELAMRSVSLADALLAELAKET